MLLSLQKGGSHKPITRWKRDLARDRKYNQKSISDVSFSKKVWGYKVLSLFPEGSFQLSGVSKMAFLGALSLSPVLSLCNSAQRQQAKLAFYYHCAKSTSARSTAFIEAPAIQSLQLHLLYLSSPDSRDRHFCLLKALAHSSKSAAPHLSSQVASGMCEQLLQFS